MFKSLSNLTIHSKLFFALLGSSAPRRSSMYDIV